MRSRGNVHRTHIITTTPSTAFKSRFKLAKPINDGQVIRQTRRDRPAAGEPVPHPNQLDDGDWPVPAAEKEQARQSKLTASMLPYSAMKKKLHRKPGVLRQKAGHQLAFRLGQVERAPDSRWPSRR